MSAARIERLLNLLTLLLNSRRPISLREIREMEEFDAYRTADPKSGERAFERDKASLIELGVPLRWVPPEQEEEDEAGVGGYLVDRERYYLGTLDLRPDELALLSIGGAAAAAMEGYPGRDAVIRALAKLGFDIEPGDLPGAMAHMPTQAGLDPKRLGRNLETVHDAMAVQQSLRCVYQRGGSDVTERWIDPYGLYYRHGTWYLVAFCHLRHAVRTFNLGRMSEAEPARNDNGPMRSAIPDDFDLSVYANRRPWEFPGGATVDVKVALDQKLVPAIREIFGPLATWERTDSGAVVALRASHFKPLIRALLPLGRAARVIEPAELRDEMQQRFARLAARYAPVSSVPVSVSTSERIGEPPVRQV